MCLSPKVPRGMVTWQWDEDEAKVQGRRLVTVDQGRRLVHTGPHSTWHLQLSKLSTVTHCPVKWQNY